MGFEPKPEDYVYRTKMNMVKGDLPRPGKVSKRFAELLQRCNKVRQNNNLEPIPIIRLYDLRHTFISICINGGVNQFQVSANYGHRNEDRHMSTTIKVYWHDNELRLALRAATLCIPVLVELLTKVTRRQPLGTAILQRLLILPRQRRDILCTPVRRVVTVTSQIGVGAWCCIRCCERKSGASANQFGP